MELDGGTCGERSKQLTAPAAATVVTLVEIATMLIVTAYSSLRWHSRKAQREREVPWALWLDLSAPQYHELPSEQAPRTDHHLTRSSVTLTPRVPGR